MDDYFYLSSFEPACSQKNGGFSQKDLPNEIVNSVCAPPQPIILKKEDMKTEQVSVTQQKLIEANWLAEAVIAPPPGDTTLFPVRGNFIMNRPRPGVRDFQTSVQIKLNATVQYQLQEPMNGLVVVAIVRRHVDYMKKPIQLKRKQPFAAFTTKLEDAKCQTFLLPGDINVKGINVFLTNEDTINLKFYRNSTPDGPGGNYSNEKYWKLLVIPRSSSKTGTKISHDEMACRAECNFQVVSSLGDNSKARRHFHVPEWLDTMFPIKTRNVKTEIIRRLEKESAKEYLKFDGYDAWQLLNYGLKYQQEFCFKAD